MSRFTTRAILMLSVCTAVAQGAPSGDEAGQMERIRRICEIMQERLGRIQNYQCTQLHTKRGVIEQWRITERPRVAAERASPRR
ncbi:MAG: hypothetical protein JW741_14705 [Sedimentisphaerales bacterium]|nr:hypothetical protein [Sedimentisphaerales bacterium]